MPITLREATEADETFLRAVYATTRAQELAAVPWNDEQKAAFVNMQFDAQHNHYHAQFPEASYEVILSGSEPIGRIYILREEDLIRILDVTLLLEHRNAGVGTEVLRDLMLEADQSGKALHIWVEDFNPSTHLFERLGFSKVQQEGFNCLLEYRGKQ
jgi:RimJ/RimL family protein N-acetyltransferase